MKIILDDETDLSNLNFLSPEEKILVVKTFTLVEEAKERMKKKGVDLSLPYKMQLKSDIAEIDRLLKKYRSDKPTEKISGRLDFLCTKLRSEVDNIFG